MHAIMLVKAITCIICIYLYEFVHIQYVICLYVHQEKLFEAIAGLSYQGLQFLQICELCKLALF